MATFNLAANTNINELASKAGDDTYNLLGYTLTIDQDSRYGFNQTTSACLGSVAGSTTAGGILNIDGRNVRLIPYNTGSGSFTPAINSTVSSGGASGVIIAFWGTLTTAPTVTGNIPASGYIKIKEWNGIAFGAGALAFANSGTASATATGVDTAGWLEIVGRESRSISMQRLCELQINGEWYELGTTNATAGQQFQIPTSGSLTWIAGIYIEKTAGAGDFEFYANAGAATDIGTEYTRGRVCWITTSGVVTIGHNGTGVAGYTPATGLRVVIGNVFLQSCAVGAFTVNNLHATIGTRYSFGSGLNGTAIFNKVTSAWYSEHAYGYSITANYLAQCDRFSAIRMTAGITLYRCGVGSTGNITVANNINCTLSGSLSMIECVAVRYGLQSSAFPINVASIINPIVTDCVAMYLTNRAAIGGYAVVLSTLTAGVITRQNCVGGHLTVIGLSDSTQVLDTIYVDNITGTTTTANGLSAIVVGASTNIFVSGISLPVTNNQPYISLVNTTGTFNTTVCDIGTYDNPINTGSVNITGNIVFGGNSANLLFKRLYVTGVRSDQFNLGNSYCDLVDYESCGSLNYTGVNNGNSSNSVQKGILTSSATVQTVVCSGSHFADFFTSATTGFVRFFNLAEKTTIGTSSNAYTLSGGAVTPALLTAVGYGVVFTQQYYSIGHIGFVDTPLTMSAGTVSNYRFRYQIDKNNGSGFGAWCASNRTAAEIGTLLAAETGIDATLGFAIKLDIVCAVTNTSVISYTSVATTTSATAQHYQYKWTGSVIGPIILTSTGAYDLDLADNKISFDVAGSYDFSTCTASGTVEFINTSGGAVTVTVPSGFSYTNTGPSITVLAPTATVNATILANSQVQLYNVTTNTEVDNVFVTTSSYQYTISTEASVGDTLRMNVCKKGRQSIPSYAIWTATGATFLIDQPEETIYTGWSIDGETCTEFSLDVTGTVEIDSNDVDGSTLKIRLGAWYNYILTTEDGIRYLYGAMSFLAANSIRINVDVLDLKVSNTNATTTLVFTDNDVRLFRSDGSSFIADVSYSIHNDYTGVPDYLIISTSDAVISGTAAEVIDAIVPTLNNVDRLSKISAAAAGGKVFGASGPVVTIRNVEDTLDVITAIVDADGNRTAITYGV